MMNVSVLNKNDLNVKEFLIGSVGVSLFYIIGIYFAAQTSSAYLIPVVTCVLLVTSLILISKRIYPSFGVRLLSIKARLLCLLLLILPVIRYIFFISLFIDDLVESEKSVKYLVKLKLIEGEDFSLV